MNIEYKNYFKQKLIEQYLSEAAPATPEPQVNAGWGKVLRKFLGMSKPKPQRLPGLIDRYRRWASQTNRPGSLMLYANPQWKELDNGYFAVFNESTGVWEIIKEIPSSTPNRVKFTIDPQEKGWSPALLIPGTYTIDDYGRINNAEEESDAVDVGPPSDEILNQPAIAPYRQA